MALKSHVTILDDIQDYLGGNSTDFTDALLTKRVTECLSEFSRYCPLIVRETFAVPSDANAPYTSRGIDISEIKGLMWINEVEFPYDQDPREFRNFTTHYDTRLSMDIDYWPADADTGYDTAAALTVSGTTVTLGADPSTADPDEIKVGDIVRLVEGDTTKDDELMYVTVTGTSMTVVRGWGRTTKTTHSSGASVYLPSLAELYCAKLHRVPVVSDLAGAATAGYTAGVRTINLDGLSTTGTIDANSTFTITGDNTNTRYTLVKDTVLASGAGDFTFTPKLAEAVASAAVVTFDNHTMPESLEPVFIDLVAARSALSISTKFIQGIPQSGRNPFRDYMEWWKNQLGVTLRKLEEEAKKYQKPYTEWPAS